MFASVMEPLVSESDDSVASPLATAAPLHISASQEASPRDNEDDGMIDPGSTEKEETKAASWQRWLLPGGILLTILLIVAVTFSIYSSSSYNNCCVVSEKCVTEFETILGSDAMGVIGYSNCNEHLVSDIPNYIPLSSGGGGGGPEGGEIYTGMKWQCVEYSRRWLISSKQVTYDSIDYAYQIWDLNDVMSVTDNEIRYPFLSYPTGQSLTPPKVGCLLIYASVDYLEPTGHVSVIVGVEDDLVLIGEQNWSNDDWLGQNYARNLTVVLSDGKYSVDDQYVIGWKCVDESR